MENFEADGAQSMPDVGDTDSFTIQEMKERFIEKMKKKHRNRLNTIILIAMGCALVFTCLTFWLIAIIGITIGPCAVEKAVAMSFNGIGPEQIDRDIDMILPNNDHEDNGYCRYLRLANHYPPRSVEFLASFLSGGGMFRCITTAGLYRQIQSSLEKKHLDKWVMITIGIVALNIVIVGKVWKPLMHTQNPHIVENGEGFYNVCDVLGIIFHFSLAECVITFFSLMSMDYYKYTDAEIEKMFEDAWRAGNLEGL